MKRIVVILITILIVFSSISCDNFASTVNREYWFENIDDLTVVINDIDKKENVKYIFYPNICSNTMVSDYNFGIYGVFKLTDTIDYEGQPNDIVFHYETSLKTFTNVVITYNLEDQFSLEDETLNYEEITPLTTLPIVDVLEAKDTLTKEFTKDLYKNIGNGDIKNETYEIYSEKDNTKSTIFQVSFIYPKDIEPSIDDEILFLEIVMESIEMVSLIE